MKLERFVMPRREFRDSRTGRVVWQVTDGDFECVPPYMHKCAWSSDDRYLVFMCNRSGTWQPYRLDLASGEAAQLAEVAGAGFLSVAVDPVHDEAYCADGTGFLAVDLTTLAQRRAVDFGAHLGPADKGGRLPALNRDGTLLVTPRRGNAGPAALLIGRTDGSDEVQVLPLPREDVNPGHQQFCPADDNVISFCNYNDRQDDPHADPALRVREWRIRRDTGQMEPLVSVPPGFHATNCLWGRSGRRFYFHRKTVPGWVPTALCSVDPNGNDLRVYYETSDHRLGHSCPSPDEQWLVTDSQDPDANLLMLVHLHRDEQHLLCWPNASINSARPDKRRADLPPHTHRHAHPGFSNTGRYVHYGSDVGGRTQVYVVDVADLVGK